MSAPLKDLNLSVEASKKQFRELWRAQIDFIRHDPARLSEAKVQIKELLDEPVSLALLAEVEALTSLARDCTPEEITKICENIFGMNCIHRMHAFRETARTKNVLKQTHFIVVDLILHTVDPTSDVFQPKHSNMPPANMNGHKLAAVYTFLPLNERYF